MGWQIDHKGWTDERVEIVKKLWIDGISASQIAKHLGGVTRNAVIGKIHRLGLSGRATPSQPRRPAFKTPRTPRPPRLVHAKPAREPKPEKTEKGPPGLPARYFAVDEPGSATVLTIGAHMCKWPIGDPANDAFTYCGRPTSRRESFCVEHARVAYQPQQKSRSSATELARSLRRYI